MGIESGQKMFALLVLPSAALAWRPAPGIPLERQIPANRQFTSTGSGSGSGGCEYEPYIQECNATEIWCDSGSYNGCWYGNYCLQQINEWDGCPGVCHMPCGCPEVNMVSKRGFMEKQKAMAHRADFGSGSA